MFVCVYVCIKIYSDIFNVFFIVKISIFFLQNTHIIFIKLFFRNDYSCRYISLKVGIYAPEKCLLSINIEHSKNNLKII